MQVRQGFENCREAIGWDHDIMVHCHWEYDLRTSIQLAQAVESIKPLWLEDPLTVEYSDSWKRLVASSNVPICTGENLARREGFKDFILNHGCDILHPDLRNSGGFLETKRIADMAAVFGLPMANHNTGSQVFTYSTCQWAASIRDYIACETITGQGGWMDQLLVLDSSVHQGRFRAGDGQAGTRHRVEPGRGQSPSCARASGGGAEARPSSKKAGLRRFFRCGASSGSGQVVAIEVHHLVPRRHEVLHERLLRVVSMHRLPRVPGAGSWNRRRDRHGCRST